MVGWVVRYDEHRVVSVLFNEPKLLKSPTRSSRNFCNAVSVLFNEPKLLKYNRNPAVVGGGFWFQCSSTSRNC